MHETLPLLLDILPSVPFAERSQLPKESGVYFALAADGTVLYVGATTNLRHRWAGHHRLQDFHYHQCCSIAYYVCTVEAMPAIEEAMIDRFHPSLNGHAVLPPFYVTHKITPVTRRLLRLVAAHTGEPHDAILDRLLSAELERLGVRAPAAGPEPGRHVRVQDANRNDDSGPAVCDQ